MDMKALQFWLLKITAVPFLLMLAVVTSPHRLASCGNFVVIGAMQGKSHHSKPTPTGCLSQTKFDGKRGVPCKPSHGNTPNRSSRCCQDQTPISSGWAHNYQTTTHKVGILGVRQSPKNAVVWFLLNDRQTKTFLLVPEPLSFVHLELVHQEPAEAVLTDTDLRAPLPSSDSGQINLFASAHTALFASSDKLVLPLNGSGSLAHSLLWHTTSSCSVECSTCGCGASRFRFSYVLCCLSRINQVEAH